MCSTKQRIANQQNAIKSTGPRTTRGKAASSRNAITHGLTATANAVVLDECREEFDEFALALRDDLRPVGAMQRVIVERIVIASWKLQRIAAAEAAIYGNAAQNKLDQVLAGWAAWDVPARHDAAHVLAAHMRDAAPLMKLQMYEQRLERSIHANLRQLAAMKKAARDSDEASAEVMAQPEVARVQNEAICEAAGRGKEVRANVNFGHGATGLDQLTKNLRVESRPTREFRSEALT